MVNRGDGKRDYENSKLKISYGEDMERYFAIADKVVSQVDEKNQKAVKSILQSERGIDAYKIIKKDGFSDRTAQKLIREGINDIAQGKRISIAAYTRALAEELTEYENGYKAIEEMHGEGILSERSYKIVIGELEEKHNSAVKTLGGLEKIAAVLIWVFVSVGAAFMFFTSTTITGAVIGPREIEPSIFFIGLALFIIGLYLLGKSKKN